MERGSFGRVVVGGVVAALALSGCQLKGGGEDLVNGKKLFVAGMRGLPRARARRRDRRHRPRPRRGVPQSRARRPGGEHLPRASSSSRSCTRTSTLRSTLRTGKTRLPLMPAKLVEGDDARDVAAYVAQAVAKEGDDPGRLAAVGASQAEGTAEAENGTLDIPVAAAGLAYQFADAKAPAGELTRQVREPAVRRRTTSRSRATASTRRARSSRAAARRSSRPTCSPASTRSSAPCPATARVAWKASSPSSSRALGTKQQHRGRGVPRVRDRSR